MQCIVAGNGEGSTVVVRHGAGAATGVVKICRGHTAWCKGSANCLNKPWKVQSVIFYFFFNGVSSECLTSWL